jgi:hypothetical protein
MRIGIERWEIAWIGRGVTLWRCSDTECVRSRECWFLKFTGHNGMILEI